MLLTKQEINKKLILPEPDIKIEEFYKNGTEYISFKRDDKPFTAGYAYIMPSAQGLRTKEPLFLRLQHNIIDTKNAYRWGEAFISEEIDLTPFKSVSAVLVTSTDTVGSDFGGFGLAVVYDDGEEYKQLGTAHSNFRTATRFVRSIATHKISRRGNLIIFACSCYYDIKADISCPYIYGEYL